MWFQLLYIFTYLKKYKNGLWEKIQNIQTLTVKKACSRSISLGPSVMGEGVWTGLKDAASVSQICWEPQKSRAWYGEHWVVRLVVYTVEEGTACSSSGRNIILRDSNQKKGGVFAKLVEIDFLSSKKMLWATLSF